MPLPSPFHFVLVLVIFVPDVQETLADTMKRNPGMDTHVHDPVFILHFDDTGLMIPVLIRKPENYPSIPLPCRSSEPRFTGNMRPFFMTVPNSRPGATVDSTAPS
jgi:hypothetical protein